VLLMIEFGFFKQNFSWSLKTAPEELAMDERRILKKKTKF